MTTPPEVAADEAAPEVTDGSVAPAGPRLGRRQRARLSRGVQYGVLLVIVVLAVRFADWGRLGRAFFDLDVMRDQFPNILTVAMRNTIIYATLGFIFGLALASVLAVMKLSSVGPYRWLATGYIEFFRGIPALLVFIALGFGVPNAFEIRFDTYTTVMLALGLSSAAYMAETIRAGLQAVPRGQVEAARSLGMRPGATLRSIVFPQAFRIVLPPLTNELILLTKDSSLVYLLGLAADQYELAKYGRASLTEFRSLSPIVVAGLCYLALTLPLSLMSRWLERRYVGSRREVGRA